MCFGTLKEMERKQVCVLKTDEERSDGRLCQKSRGTVGFSSLFVAFLNRHNCVVKRGLLYAPLSITILRNRQELRRVRDDTPYKETDFAPQKPLTMKRRNITTTEAELSLKKTPKGNTPSTSMQGNS